MRDTTLPDWLVSDPKLTAIFGRIARALPNYQVPPGLTAHTLLEAYACLIEEQADVSLLVAFRPRHGPDLPS
jgi:hypothetical protein